MFTGLCNVVVGLVLKVKTGFRGLKPNGIRDFESLQRYGKKFCASVHEIYPQKDMHSRDILKFVNFINHEYKAEM